MHKVGRERYYIEFIKNKYIQLKTTSNFVKVRGLRGKIEVFSRRSASNLRKHLYSLQNTSDDYVITLTFPVYVCYEDFRRCLEVFKHRLYRHKVLNKNYYVFKLEFTASGRPHFHVYIQNHGSSYDDIVNFCQLWIDSVDKVFSFDRRTYYNFILAGTSIEKVSDDFSSVIKYFCYYVSSVKKGYQNKLPQGYRCSFVYKFCKQNAVFEEVNIKEVNKEFYFSFLQSIFNTIKVNFFSLSFLFFSNDEIFYKKLEQT